MAEPATALVLISAVNDEQERMRGLRLEWGSTASTEQVRQWLQWLLVDKAFGQEHPRMEFWVAAQAREVVDLPSLGSIRLHFEDLPPPAPARLIKGATTGSTVLLKLLSQITSDAETRDIEDTLKHTPDLSVQLLRLVNSVSFNLKEPVTSFAQAINILGRRQLQRWLQLLMFSGKAHAGDGRPLMARAAMRGALMEQLALARGQGREVCDMAFIVGMFSLLDVLFGKPIADIVLPLKMGDEINQALLHRSGVLGRLLSLADSAEHHDLQAVASSLADLQLDSATWSECQLTALQWMLSIGHDD